MSDVKNFVNSLEAEIREQLEAESIEFVMKSYGAPKGMTEEELVEFCVSVEYENSFK